MTRISAWACGAVVEAGVVVLVPVVVGVVVVSVVAVGAAVGVVAAVTVEGAVVGVVDIKGAVPSTKTNPSSVNFALLPADSRPRTIVTGIPMGRSCWIRVCRDALRASEAGWFPQTGSPMCASFTDSMCPLPRSTSISGENR